MAVITISRQYGSGGDEIAFELSKALGYALFDKRIVLDAAREAGLFNAALEEPEIVDYSEDNYKVRGFLDRLFGGTPIMPYPGTWSDDLTVMYGMEEMRMREEDSLHLVQRAVDYAYKAGNIVIVGRGGQVLLKDRLNTLHVRIVAPLDKRIERVRDQLKFFESQTEEKKGNQLETRAAQIIHERDEASADYIRRFYHVDRSDPLLYHLIINTGRVSNEQAVRTIQQMIELQEA